MEIRFALAATAALVVAACDEPKIAEQIDAEISAETDPAAADQAPNGAPARTDAEAGRF